MPARAAFLALCASSALCALLTGAACSVPPANAVYDLAAIHDDSWRPRTPAQMSVDPEVYLESGKETPHFRIGELPMYEVGDHRGVEHGILRRIAETPPSDLGVSLEATGYLVFSLLHDDFADARVQSAAILSQFAGFWIERVGAKPPGAEPDGDMAAAVAAYDQATADPDAPDYKTRVEAALQQIDRARLDDPEAGALLVAGMGRRYRNGRIGVTGDAVPERAAVRTILLALERGESDPDAGVADACRQRRALILQYLAAHP